MKRTQGLHPALIILIFLVMLAIYVIIFVAFVQNIVNILNGDHNFWTVAWTTIEGLALVSGSISTNRNSSK